MKWNNKGHEFDQVYENIKRRNKLYLFGAGDYGEKIYDLLCKEKDIQGFIDNNIEKQKQGYCGKKVYDISEIDKTKDDVGIILCVSPYTRKPIMQQLMAEGYRYNR